MTTRAPIPRETLLEGVYHPFWDSGFPDGTRLVGHYKGNDYFCVVIHDNEGTPLFVVLPNAHTEGGLHTSITAAASSFMSGRARADGWRFWELVPSKQPENYA